MKYEILESELYSEWLYGLNSTVTNRILARMDRVAQGNFGDYKRLSEHLYELRFTFGGGYRVYFTIKDNQIIFLLHGGDKNTQKKDIKKAEKLLQEID